MTNVIFFFNEGFPYSSLFQPLEIYILSSIILVENGNILPGGSNFSPGCIEPQSGPGLLSLYALSQLRVTSHTEVIAQILISIFPNFNRGFTFLPNLTIATKSAVENLYMLKQLSIRFLVIVNLIRGWFTLLH